jgi:hypothetical protein
MLKREDRVRKVAEWLEHLQGWKSSGETLAAYVRRCGLSLSAAYQWRAALIREGSWSDEPGVTRRASHQVPQRFARVAVAELPQEIPVIVRVQLGNGRRAEIELGRAEQLREVVDLLERPA